LRFSTKRLRRIISPVPPFPRYTVRTTIEADELRLIFRAVRSNGHAAIEDQLEYGNLALAVPVKDVKGRLFAAVSC
jgi:IclR family transcriptional regulator, pca regulon regulatory protein